MFDKKSLHGVRIWPIFLVLLLLAVCFFLEHRSLKLEALSGVLGETSYTYSSVDNEAKIKVVLLGDSRVKEWTFNWPSNIAVANAGVSGSTAFQALARLDSVIQLKPDWVVIQVGVNDIVASRVVLGESRQQVLNDTADRIVAINERLVQSGINVIFVTVLASINTDIARYLFWQGNLSSPVKWLNLQLQERIPSEVFILNANDIFQKADGSWRQAFVKDSLHWTDDAYFSLSTSVLEIILGA